MGMRPGTRQHPLTAQEFRQLIHAARVTNEQRDQGERATGFAAPGDDGVWNHLRTAMSAVEAGIRTGETDCLAEGYAMLEVIEAAICPPDYRRPVEPDETASEPKARPTHRTLLHEPRRPPRVVAECIPIRPLTLTEWCKYCHRTHAAWWLMDQQDYQIDGLTIVLCGYCEHTSGLDATDPRLQETS